MDSDNLDAEFERAYRSVIDAGVAHQWKRRAFPSISAQEIRAMYEHALETRSLGSATAGLAAERWARTVNHLTLALWHEAKLDYMNSLEQEHAAPPPSIQRTLHNQEMEGASRSLLDSAHERLTRLTPQIHLQDTRLARLVSRGRFLLEPPQAPEKESRFSYEERTLAAHEYGRALEYWILALDSESDPAFQAA